MRLKTIFGVLVLLALTAGTAMAATIPVTGNVSQLQLASESRAALDFRVEVGQIQTLDVSTKAGNFTRLIIPGYHTSMVEGAPELPMMNRLIAVPTGANARVEVRNIRTRVIDLADFGVENQVFPTQPSISKSADLSTIPFIYDRAAYDVSEVRSDLIRVVEQGRLRAMDIARLEISPVSYFPRTNQIEVVESADVSVYFDGADHSAQTDLIAKTYSPFFEYLYAGFAGGERAFQDDYPDRVGDVVTMVVVTAPDFVGQLADFIAWKTERGFNVITAVVGSAEVGSTATSIQTYLHGLYNNATPEEPAPSFVLFVGDVAQVPTFTEGGDATDRPYCAVDADLVPDMYYGRLSATNPTELQAQLDKTMMYDQYTMPDPSYLGNVTLIAGVDGTYATTHGNGQINYGTEHYFNAAHGINSNTYLYPESNSGVESELIGTYNDGVSFINYTAHGSTTSWGNPSLSQSDINALTNYGKYFLAVGNCCLTSSYDIGECFGETFLRAEDKGAIGYIGGSNSTYWDEDYWWGVGYHASSEIDGSAYPYESTGIGAYDGVFHDHGEADHLWYVTNDALVFSGNLAVMESGSSRTTYYWNIYNLLGDPSLSTFMGVPSDNAVSHMETIFMGVPTFTVNAEYGSYVGATQDGVLVASGTVGASGSIDLEWSQILTPGVPVKLVVMAQNRVPYIEDIMVIVPADVSINPMAIDANVLTDVTVTVMESDGVTPKPGINIWAEGLGYTTTPVMTDASGVAVLSLIYPYGPTLDIVGQDPADSYRLFTEQITVNAADLTSPDLSVSTDIGLFDSFALNLPGTLNATVAEGGHTLAAMLPDGSIVDTADYELTVTPTELGQVTGMIAVSGYNIYSESFDIIEAYGTLSGTVTTGGGAMSGVVVNCLDEFGGTVFSVTTDASGAYASPEEILVDDYTMVVDHFGYLHYEVATFVNYGANVFDIDLTAAPSGVLSGTVIDNVTYEPLQGVVRIYRTDTGDLYNEAYCNEDGEFTSTSLPYFDYEIRARAWHHVPVTLVMTIDDPSVVKNFALEPTNGDLLLIDDGAKSSFAEVKMGGKLGNEMLAEGYELAVGKSATQMAADLEEMGYFVETIAEADVDPAEFVNYDLVILSSSNNTAPVENATLRDGLVNFALAGGHILVEGGEVGYDAASYPGYPEFAANVLHSTDWNHDSSGSISIYDAEAYVLNNPNPGCGDIAITFDGYGDSDAMVPLGDAEMPTNWTEYPTDASTITYDPNPAPTGGQIVYFAWNYLAAGEGRYALLENAVLWLLNPELGNCSVSGTVMLAGETDFSGVTITAIPNGGVITTGPDGTYQLQGLYPGTYTVIASKADWATQAMEVTLADGQNLTGVDFVLTPTVTFEACSEPAVAIPDNDPTGISDVLSVNQTGEVSDILVYLDVTHTYIGDLIVTLTSPTGTSVVLHNRTGGSAEDILGWYPTELTPVDDFSALIGEEMFGDWTLAISDNAGIDTGTLNEWCLQIVYPSGVVPAGVMPMAVNAGSGMNLSWSYNPALFDGFNVYRRTETTQRVRLNSELLSNATGQIQYVDGGEGLVEGQKVFYSYAIVNNGAEVAFGDEIEATFRSGLPTVYALHNNYPNPFNPMTSIKFDLPRSGQVKLAVYDIAGRLVKTLVNEVREASTHTVLWDGTDAGGRRVASGTYYYMLVTDDFQATHKMMLVK